MSVAMRSGGYRRAIYLSTSSSLLVPLAGLASAPLLARGLGVDGRGELAAAMAPAALLIATATFGLPEALTFYLARWPERTRRSLAWSSLVVLALGGVSLLIVIAFADQLTAGNSKLSMLTTLATALAIPALIINILRGAAIGRQMWAATAVEKVINAGTRVLALFVLVVAGALTVPVAVVTLSMASILAGFAYIRLFRAVPDDRSAAGGGFVPKSDHFLASLLGYGSRIWFGSVASMLLSRATQILMVPLSSPRELGLLSVAITISDVPLLVASAIPGALFGLASASPNRGQLLKASRMTVFLTLLVCTVLAATLPAWIGFVFGGAFQAALTATLILIGAAAVSVPGSMGAAALAAWARPGLRSLGLAALVPINVVALLVLVPRMGATGAALATLVTNAVGSTYLIVSASRVMKVRARSFVCPTLGDLRDLRAEFDRLKRRSRERVVSRNC